MKIVAQVQDQDGEVLLIEAAEHLPKWAQEPELAENRVFVYKGKVHLIPVAQTPAELTPLPSGCPEILDAVTTVINHWQVTEASEKVQSVIRARIGTFPQDWSHLMHYSHVIVPKKLKYVLTKHPDLISKAIRLFYTRDPIGKSCRLNFPALFSNFNGQTSVLQI